ncbi:hypothetical protein PMAYCL1PPCAC_31569, partial [Pristionchus mayeri]
MSLEEQAAQCRRDLRASIGTVDALTANPCRAAELLLQQMNGVLRATINGGATGSCGALNSLYESISHVQQESLSHIEDLQFFLFARNFAVVIEEAARQQQQYSAAKSSPSSQTAPQQLIGSFAWRRAKEREYPGKELDFTIEGVKGGLTIFRVARCVREEELRALLLPFGSIVEFFFDKKPTRGDCYALAKLQSNEAADEAVTRLNGRLLGGTAIIVRRAEYWTKTAPLLQQLQQ